MHQTKMVLSFVALLGSLGTGSALACGDMMLEIEQGNGQPAVDIVGTKIRSGEGDLSAEEIASVYRGDAAAQLCYEELLTRIPGLSGMVLSTVEISAGGKVLSVKVHDRISSKDKVFVNCLTTAFQKLTFPAPRDGQLVKASTVLRMNVGTQSIMPDDDLKDAIVNQSKGSPKKKGS